MDRPSWVQPAPQQQMSTGFMPAPPRAQPMLGGATASGSGLPGATAPDAAGNTGMLDAAHATAPNAPGPNNPNAWDGIGPNTNRDQQVDPFQQHSVSNVGNPVNAAGANLPPNIQQWLQMFQGMGGQGLTGFQPVQGNPFANLGSNLNPWGTASGPGGIYGGT